MDLTRDYLFSQVSGVGHLLLVPAKPTAKDETLIKLACSETLAAALKLLLKAYRDRPVGYILIGDFSPLPASYGAGRIWLRKLVKQAATELRGRIEGAECAPIPPNSPGLAYFNSLMWFLCLDMAPLDEHDVLADLLTAHDMVPKVSYTEDDMGSRWQVELFSTCND